MYRGREIKHWFPRILILILAISISHSYFDCKFVPSQTKTCTLISCQDIDVSFLSPVLEKVSPIKKVCFSKIYDDDDDDDDDVAN